MLAMLAQYSGGSSGFCVDQAGLAKESYQACRCNHLIHSSYTHTHSHSHSNAHTHTHTHPHQLHPHPHPHPHILSQSPWEIEIFPNEYDCPVGGVYWRAVDGDGYILRVKTSSSEYGAFLICGHTIKQVSVYTRMYLFKTHRVRNAAFPCN